MYKIWSKIDFLELIFECKYPPGSKRIYLAPQCPEEDFHLVTRITVRKKCSQTGHFKFSSQNDDSSPVLANSSVRKVRKMLEYSSEFIMAFFWPMEALFYSKTNPCFMIININLTVKTNPIASHILTVEPR